MCVCAGGGVVVVLTLVIAYFEKEETVCSPVACRLKYFQARLLRDGFSRRHQPLAQPY